MFGMIGRTDKNARVFCAMKDRRKEALLPLIKNNDYTSNFHDDELYLRACIYSACYSVYQESDFRNSGYTLNRVNHSV